MKEVTDIKEYCKCCVNARTPLCDSCRYVECNGSITKRPTQFVGLRYDDRTKLRMRMRDLCVLIEGRAKREEFIPVQWVLEYNRLVEDDRGFDFLRFFAEED